MPLDKTVSHLKGFIDPKQNPATKFGMQTGQMIEDSDRLAHFIWRLRKGDAPKEAAKSVQKYLFDYKYGLTGFESQLFRNTFLPFYAWTRFNIPLQLEMLVNKPIKYARVGKVKRTLEDEFGGPEPNESVVADWIRNGLSLRWRHDKKTDTYQYFMLGNWWPGADVQTVTSLKEFGQEFANLLNPMVKVPFIELPANYNLFTHRKISRYPGEKKTIRTPFGQVSLDARLDHALRTMRLFNEIDRTLQAYDYDGWVTAIWRPLIGRSYPQRMEQQKIYIKKGYNVRAAELKRARAGIQKRGERGSEIASDAPNIETLDRLILEAEAARDALK